MASPRRSTKRKAAAPQSARVCRGCQKLLQTPGDVGWECRCGVVVCTQEGCVEEYFKFVAGGEATRCLSCGEIL